MAIFKAQGRKLTHLRHFRQLRGMTQEELAHRAGLVATTVHRLETGKSLAHGGTSKLLAQALGISVAALEGRSRGTKARG